MPLVIFVLPILFTGHSLIGLVIHSGALTVILTILLGMKLGIILRKITVKDFTCSSGQDLS